MTEEELHRYLNHEIRGVRYNVVRRSAHKTSDSMMKKILEDHKAGRIDEWFARWNVEITERDLARFKQQCLDPVLENVCDDYEWFAFAYNERVDHWNYELRANRFKHHRKRHFRLPYGVYSPVHEGGFGDADDYLENGSMIGLHRAETLFNELA